MDNISYFTGLSINKLQWDKTYSEAFNDDDYETGRLVALEVTEQFLEGPLSKLLADAFIDEVMEFTIDVLVNHLPFAATHRKYKDRANIRKELSNRERIAAASPWVNELFNNTVGLEKLADTIKNMDVTVKDGTVVSDNFFSLFTTNQSDSRMFSPLSRLGAAKQNRAFNVSWGYCDLPYFHNKFIDRLGIQVTQHYFSEAQINADTTAFTDLVSGAFASHFFDVVVSRALAKQFEIDKTILAERDDFTELKNRISSIQHKNMYGLVVISNLLFKLYAELKHQDQEAKLAIMLVGDDNQKQYLEHVVQLSGYSSIIITDNEATAHLVLTIMETEDATANFLSCDKNQYLPGVNEHLRKYISFQDTGFTRGDTKYFDVYKIVVPVKMFFSLPNDENNKASANIDVPSRLYQPALNNSERILLTVGGSEHNRALAYFLSRAKREGNHSFIGLLDNRFHIEAAKVTAGNCFLAGINQPVGSMYNSRFFQRKNSGWESTSLRGALVCFKYGPYSVVSLFGFSAIASRLLQELTLTRIAGKKKNTSLFRAITGISKSEFSTFEETGDPIIHQYFSTHSIDKINRDLAKITNGLDVFAYMNQSSRKEIARLGDLYENCMTRL